MWWLLISALALLALWSLWEQRRIDRENDQALFELERRVTLLEAERFILPPAPDLQLERLLIPPPFPLPPPPELPMQSKLTRAWTRVLPKVWRQG